MTNVQNIYEYLIQAYLIFAYDIPCAVDGVLCLFHIQSVNEDGPPQPGCQSKWPEIENFLLGNNCTSVHYRPYLGQNCTYRCGVIRINS
jgi:hypothetical protein